MIIAFMALALGANAQTKTATASTVLKIKVTEFISVEDGNLTTVGTTPAAGAEVNFIYDEAADYEKDQEKVITNHLKVASTNSFQVTAKAMGPNFESGINTIPVGVLDVTPAAPGSGTAKTIRLTDAEQQVLTGVKAGLRQIDVKYTIPAKRAQEDILGRPSGTYQQTIIYKFSHL